MTEMNRMEIVERKYEEIAGDLEQLHTPECLWNASRDELMDEIDTLQADMLSMSLRIGFCLSRLREMETAQPMQQ